MVSCATLGQLLDQEGPKDSCLVCISLECFLCRVYEIFGQLHDSRSDSEDVCMGWLDGDFVFFYFSWLCSLDYWPLAYIAFQFVGVRILFQWSLENRSISPVGDELTHVLRTNIWWQCLVPWFYCRYIRLVGIRIDNRNPQSQSAWCHSLMYPRSSAVVVYICGSFKT